MGITIKTLHDYGAFAKNKLAEMRLKEISWNGDKPVMDLRVWIDSKTAKNGITMSKKDLKKLGEIIDSLRINDEDEEVFPMNEPESDDDEIIDFSSGESTTIEKTAKSKSKSKKNEKESNSDKKKDVVIKFPEPKHDIKVAHTENNATYELCKAKLDKEVKPFNKAWEEIEYLYDGINKELSENEQFCKNFYREDKTFVDMFHYLNRNAADNAVAIEGVMIMLHATALAICLDYFNAEDEPKVKEVEVKKPTRKKATKNTSTKKAAKPKAKLILEAEDDDDEVISF